MMNLRAHGVAPFRVAVVHGGPGAAGEMAPVARRLADKHGVLEPLQTELSVQGQVEELRNILLSQATLPVVLVGFSWGAWLSILLASKSPELVRKLVLVSSGGFIEASAKGLSDRRLSRLRDEERAEFQAFLAALNDPEIQNKDALFSTLGRLAAKADAYDPIDDAEEPDPISVSAEIFRRVWSEAAEMRRTGVLLHYVQSLTCPVVALHGDSDPHLAAGVFEPLSASVADFRFVLLTNCGHTPWRERRARERFYEILLAEIA
jgi:pimeloyl-ACP methyl ester carboxylesterase